MGRSLDKCGGFTGRGAAAWGLALYASAFACSTRTEAPSIYPQVAEVVQRSCAVLRCHGIVSGAHLELMQTELRQALVGVPSCEYPPFSLVEPGDPERSWIMIKLTAPVFEDQYLPFIDFEPPAPLAERKLECEGELDNGRRWFGVHMPAEGPALGADEIELVRAWIEDGAQGP